MTVRELIDISQYFYFRVNGDDYDEDRDHYADDWIVYCQTVEVYTNLSVSSYDGDVDAVTNTSMYLYISAQEARND